MGGEGPAAFALRADLLGEEPVKSFHIGNDRAKLMKALSLLANFLIRDTDDYELILQRREHRRSNEQNRRYWAILNEIAALDVQGRKYTAETWHEYFKGRFIGNEDIELPNGKTLLRPISTTTLDKIQFGEYMTQIEAWASQHGLLLFEDAA